MDFEEAKKAYFNDGACELSLACARKQSIPAHYLVGVT